jgi:hypothetical protein
MKFLEERVQEARDAAAKAAEVEKSALTEISAHQMTLNSIQEIASETDRSEEAEALEASASPEHQRKEKSRKRTSKRSAAAE